jgi:NAD(P)-dependent dehydrogenase (short-subunit alcohol dehydrogenase family)
MLARDAGRLRRFEADLPGARAFPADVSDPAQLEAARGAVEAHIGSPEVMIHNAVGAVLSGPSRSILQRCSRTS